MIVVLPTYIEILSCLAEREDVTLERTTYSPETFGDFVVSFKKGSDRRSLLNERFHLYFCDGRGGEGDRQSIAADIRNLTPAEVVEAVRQFV